MRRLILLSAFLAAPALADEPTIVVTGTALPDTPAAPAYDTVTLDRETLADAPSGRLEDALGGVAGFQQFRRSDSRSSNPSAQGVTLRALGGNATSRTLVLLDGVPMADPFFGFVPLSALAPERLASARVMRGGGSGAFGAGAVAGTIDLTSAGAGELGLLEGRVMADDRGETEASASFAPRLGSGFAVVSARWDRGQGFWTTPEAQRVPASVRARYDSWSAGLRGVAPLSGDVELQVRGLAFQDNRTLRFAGADSMARGEEASLRLVGRGPWQFDVLAYVQARDFSNVVISSTTFRKTLDQYGTPATGIGGKAELRPPVGGGHVLKLGADWRSGSGKTQEIAYNGGTGAVTARRSAGGRQGDLGLFAEDDWTLGALVLTGGVRADRWSQSAGFFREASAAGLITADTRYPDRSGWQATFRGGAVLALGERLKLRAAGYTGIRLPTLNELYRPFTVFPITTRANAALANEKVEGMEAGFDWRPTTPLSLSVTAFSDRLANAIANVTIGSNLRERRNVDAIRARGVEVTGSAAWKTLRFDLSVAFTDASVVASGSSAALNGLRPAQTPKLAASATLAWNPAQNWALALTLRHVGSQYEDDLQTDVLPAATTLSAYVEVPIGRRFALLLRGENLTDTRVVTRNQTGSLDLGIPRTLWAGVKVSMR